MTSPYLRLKLLRPIVLHERRLQFALIVSGGQLAKQHTLRLAVLLQQLSIRY
jgi:hypothetical protein